VRRGDLLFLLHTQSIPELIKYPCRAFFGVTLRHITFHPQRPTLFLRKTSASHFTYPTNSSATPIHKKAGKS
jgi:hypothetical protein